MSTALGLGRATSTGDLISEATTSPQTIGNRFTFPDGNEIFNINSTVTALWVTDKPDCSIQLNCTLDATAEPFTSPGTKLDQLDHARKCSSALIFAFNEESRCRPKVADCLLTSSSKRPHNWRLTIPTAEQVRKLYLKYACYKRQSPRQDIIHRR